VHRLINIVHQFYFRRLSVTPIPEKRKREKKEKDRDVDSVLAYRITVVCQPVRVDTGRDAFAVAGACIRQEKEEKG
jgi:hypothetical protein